MSLSETAEQVDARLATLETRTLALEKQMEMLAPVAVHLAEMNVRQAELVARLERMMVWITRIEEHTRTTNGRIGKLELWQAKIDGAKWAFSWAPAVLVGVVVAVVSAAATSLILT